MTKKNPIGKDLKLHTFKSNAMWLKWLSKNFDQEEGIWVRFAKKASKLKTITYEEAREGAIIYGWIDGQIKGIDDDSFMRKFTPRRKRSIWSKINRGIAQELIHAKRMAPSGLAQVNAAKQDGRWDAAYDSPSTIKPEPEFTQLLNSNPSAKTFFDQLDKTNRYSFLARIQMARTEATKTKRIAESIEMLTAGKVFHPDRLTKGRKMRWCVLLRGINVGGKRSIKMAELRKALESKKFQNVQTYIQSGNICLTSSKTDAAIEKTVKQLIKKEWGHDVPVQAVSEKELKKIFNNNPFKTLDVTKTCVTRFDKSVPASTKKQIAAIATNDEQFLLKQNHVYLYCPHGFSKTKLTNGFFEKQLNVSATTRNWKTVTKMLEMISQS